MPGTCIGKKAKLSVGEMQLNLKYLGCGKFENGKVMAFKVNS